MGITLGMMGSNQEALSHLEKAVALGPDDRSAHYNLVIIYQRLDQVAKASAECRRWLEKHPRSAWELARLAWHHIDRALPEEDHDPDQTIKFGTEAARLTAWRNPEHILALAFAWQAKGDRAKSKEYADKARKLVAEGKLAPVIEESCRALLEELDQGR